MKPREEKRLSLEKFAELVGVGGKSTVSNWEKGRRMPDLDQVAKIAKACGVSTDYIILGEESESLIIKQLKEREKELSAQNDRAIRDLKKSS